MSQDAMQPNRTVTEPATAQACAADYAARHHGGQATAQRGYVYASAQDGIPRTTSSR